MIDDTTKWLFSIGIFQSMNLKESRAGDFNAGNLFFFATMIYLAVACFLRRSPNLLLDHFRRLSFCSILLLMGGHLLYDWSGGRFGERFFFEITWMILFHFVALVFDVFTQIRSVGLQRTLLATTFVLLNLGSFLIYQPQTAAYLRRANQKRMDLFIKTDSKSFETSVIHILSPPEMLQNWYARNNPDLSGTIYLPFNSMMISDLQQTFKGRTHYVYIFNQKAGHSTLVPLEEFLSLPPNTR